MLFFRTSSQSFSLERIRKAYHQGNVRKWDLIGWLVVLRFNATLIAVVISWRSVTHMFPGFLTPVLTQLFFPKPLTTFLTCFCRGERQKTAGKKSRLNRGSNSQPPSHRSDTLTTEPPGRGCKWDLKSKHSIHRSTQVDG